MLLRSPKGFLRKLRKEAHDREISDLEQKLTWIEDDIRNLNLWNDFQRNPYRKENGELVYFMGEPDSDENLLETFTIEQINELVERPVVKKGDVEIYETYQSNGKIILFPDTNVWISPLLLRTLNRDSRFDVDVLTIVREELYEEQGRKIGLGRYGGKIPTELIRGNDSIRKRLLKLKQKGSYVAEIEKIYDCVYDYFQRRVRTLEEELRRHPEWSDKRIAETVSNSEAEFQIYKKQVEKLRNGNGWNLVVDRLIVSASYAFNLASTRNIAIVITRDGDLGNINEIIKNEIIPLYMSRDAYQLSRGFFEKIRSSFSSPEGLIPYAREHLRTSETAWKSKTNNRHSAGIVYNPGTDEFSFSTLPQAYVNYIHNIDGHRIGKQKIICASAIWGLSPKNALKILIGESFQPQPGIEQKAPNITIDASIPPGSFHNEN